MRGVFVSTMLVTCGSGALAILSTFVGCDGKPSAQPKSDTASLVIVPVKRQTITIDVSSNGQIEPIRTVEIKSKASGKILRLPVEVGDVVNAGALIAQVDTTEAATQVRQKRADLEYVRAQLIIAESKKQRDEDLLRQGMISRDQFDQDNLEYARIRSSLISTDAALEAAAERLRETVVRAPIRGTVLEKSAEEGQIISSATTGVTSGTTLMKMADLTTLQVRIFMDQTDLGKIRPGMEATVIADAYRSRKFEARVLKIAPLAKKQREVNYFPILVRISNEEGLLLPGMDCSVNIHVSKVENAIAVSSDAVITLDDAEKVGPLLDIPQDTVKAAIVAAGGTPTGVTEMASAREQIPPWLLQGMRRPQSMQPVNAAIVFVVDTTNSHIRPVPIKFGVQSWDVTEVKEGLTEGLTALIPPSAMVAQQFKEYREWMSRYSTGLPGKK